MIVDLAQVPFLDSAALGLLMITHRQLVADKRRLSLAHPQATVRQIIELANLHKTIPLIESNALPWQEKRRETRSYLHERTPACTSLNGDWAMPLFSIWRES